MMGNLIYILSGDSLAPPNRTVPSRQAWDTTWPKQYKMEAHIPFLDSYILKIDSLCYGDVSHTDFTYEKVH